MQPVPAATPLVSSLADRLVTAIAVGEFLPGSRLPAERDLAVQLGVGRTTVRAALGVLHALGLIDTSRGRSGGSYIRTQWAAGSSAAVLRDLRSRWTDLSDQLEAMRRIHGSVARAAAEHRTDDDLVELDASLAAYRAAGDPRRKQAADARLHLAIADAAKNATMKAFQVAVDGSLSLSAPAHLWGDPDHATCLDARADREHELLIAAIRDRRPDDADRVAREHARLDRYLVEAARRRAERIERPSGKCA